MSLVQFLHLLCHPTTTYILTMLSLLDAKRMRPPVSLRHGHVVTMPRCHHLDKVKLHIYNYTSTQMETVRHLVRRVLRHKDTFCGWLYSKQEIESLISEYYDIERHANMGNSALYLLSSADCPHTASQGQGFVLSGSKFHTPRVKPHSKGLSCQET